MKRRDLTCERCSFKPVRNRTLLFACTVCDALHACGDTKCENLFYNSDFTQVCSITGICFNQRICDTFATTQKIVSGKDPVYFKRVKRDQQIKNKVLDRKQVAKIIKCASVIVHLNDMQHTVLCAKILDLWTQFVNSITIKREYVHRKDKRCFVVAIIMSLKEGIMTDDQNFIVSPHTHIKSEKLNKKSDYTEFCVSDIRYGQTLIKRVFNGLWDDSTQPVYVA